MELIGHVKALCSMGSRHAGFGGDLKAAGYIEKEFEAAGLSGVQKEHFTCNCWEFTRCEAEFLSGNGSVASGDGSPFSGDGSALKLPVLPFFFSSSTPEGGLLCDVVYMETIAHPRYLTREEMAGKAVLLYEEEINEEQYAWFIENGAAAVIMVTEREGPLIGQLLIEDMLKYQRIPLLSIRHRDAETVLRKGMNKVRLVVETEARRDAHTCNVTGGLIADGARNSIVIGAHYDTVPLPAAAKDNTAGVAVLLGAAAILARAGLKNLNVRFAAFSAEEMNREGAFNYISRHRDDLRDCRLMLNIDGTGDFVGKNCLQVLGCPELGSFCRDVAEGLKYPARVENIEMCYLDNAFFTSRGIPSAFLGRFPNMPWHTPADTAELVSGAELDKAAAYICGLVKALDRMEEPPAWTVDDKVTSRLNRELPHIGR